MPFGEKEQLDRAALDGRIQRAASERGGELVLNGWVSFDAAELAAALGAGGEAARALTTLNVCYNGIGDAGMAALAAALAGGACPGLTKLHVYDNGIGEAGMAALAAALAGGACPGLTALVQPSMDWSALQSAVSSVPAPSADAELAVRLDGTPALMETEGKKQYRLYELSLVLSDEPVHRFSIRFSEAQEQNTQLLQAGVISKEQAATFPAWSSDHLRDFVKNEANVQRRASELQAYYAAILTQPAVLQHPQLREIIGFDFDLLVEQYMGPFELARRDPSLLRRAVAFFAASGDVLHYSGIEALRDRVFLRPLWVSDLMAALVRHDLDERLAMLGDEGTMLRPARRQHRRWSGRSCTLPAAFWTRGCCRYSGQTCSLT
eukprot:COSAG06_NODE_6159_length_3076_cov_9.513432_3_plen_379_part_00